MPDDESDTRNIPAGYSDQKSGMNWSDQKYNRTEQLFLLKGDRKIPTGYFVMDRNSDICWYVYTDMRKSTALVGTGILGAPAPGGLTPFFFGFSPDPFFPGISAGFSP